MAFNNRLDRMENLAVALALYTVGGKHPTRET
jgi:hypothetical protein